MDSDISLGGMEARIGPYALLHELGHGATSRVFLAERPEDGRRVLLKVARGWDPKLEALFQQEYALGSRVRHPHLGSVLDHGRGEAGRPFVVLEFYPGEPLADLPGPTSAGELARIGLQLARALQALHEEGLVHRDVTPANVIVENGGNLRLVDFGLLAPLGSAPLSASGTPLFLAPEALAGRPLDGRADLYALGALLYRQACGRAPFEELPVETLWAAVLEGTIEPLSLRAPHLPAALTALVMRLLAKEPGDRPANAAEVAGALARFLGAGCQLPLGEGRWQATDAFEAWSACAGEPGVVAFSGARGLGHTRHLREAFAAARREQQQAVWLEPEEGDGPYALVERLWRWAVARAPLALEALPASMRAPLVALWPHAFPDGAPAGEPGRLAEALPRALLAMTGAAVGPGCLLMVIDRWDAVDAASRSVLSGLWGRGAGASYTWLLGCEVAPDGARDLPLAPFEPLRAAAWIAGCWQEEPPAELATRLIAASAGNPGWMAQALAHLRANGANDAGSGAIALPSTVEAMLEARWSRLSPDQRSLAEVLVLYAVPFVLDDLLPLASLLPANWPLELAQLTSGGLLRQDGGSYRFAHGWWAGFIRTRLAPVRRAKLAEKLGLALEPPGSGAAREPALLHRLACLFAMGDRVEPKVRYALEAGLASARVFANEEAIAHLAMGLDAISSDPRPARFKAERLAMRVAMADVQRLTGEFAAAAEAYQACLHEVQSPAERGKLLVSLGKARQMLNQFGPAAEALEEAVAILQPLPAIAERLRALTSLGRVQYYLDARETSADTYERALSLARAFEEGAYEAEALSFLGTLMVGAGETVAKGLTYLQEALRLRESLDDHLGRNDTHMLLGNAYFNLGRFAAALEHFEANRSLAREVGHVQEEGFAALNLALCQIELGGWKAARVLLESAHQLASTARDGLLLGLVGILSSWVLLNLGDVPAADASLAEAREREAAMGSPFLRLYGLLYEAERHAFLGAFEPARRAAELAIGLIEKGTGSENLVRARLLLSEAWLHQGQILQAEQHLALANEAIGRSGMVAPRAWADRLAGWVAFRQGDWPEAREAWERSLDLARREGLAGLEVRLLLGMHVLARQDVPGAAPLADLARAYALCEPLRAPEPLALACLGLAVQHAADQNALLAERLGRRGHELLGVYTQALPSRYARQAFLAHPMRTPFCELATVEESQALVQKSRRLEMLLELGTIIGTTRDPDRVLELVRGFTLEVTQAERCLIFLNPGRGEWRLYGPAATYSQTIVRRVAQTREPSCVMDAQSDDELRASASILDLQVRSVMCVPMAVGHVLHGVLYVDSRVMLGAFTPDDLRCLMAIANQAAVALDNARMYTVLREQAKEREAYIRRLEESEGVIRYLEEADRLRAQHFQSSSHDLRGPLASITVSCQALGKGIMGELSADQAETIEGIQHGAKSLLGLIDDILDAAQIEAGKLLLNPKPVPIGRVVAAAASLLSALAADKGLALRWDETVLEALPPVRGDERRLGRMLQNLLGNAIKYTEQGHVTISARCHAGMLELTVADSGPGLPPERRDDPFERYGASHDAGPTASSGMGLWLVKGLVELHGGQIHAESEPGRGTSFVVRLPLWSAEGAG